MSRFRQNSPVPLETMVQIYYQGSTECIYAFIEKRITRFQQPPPKRGYEEALQSPQPDTLVSSVREFQHLCGCLNIDASYVWMIGLAAQQVQSTLRLPLLNYQAQELSRKVSYYFVIKRIALARQNCILTLKSLLESGLKVSIARLSELEKLSTLMIHVRMLTLVLVENIYEWNYSLSSLSDVKNKDWTIKYESEGVDVLKMVCEDSSFLRNTVLRKYLKFAKGPDPLLIRVAKKKKENRSTVDEGQIFSDFFLDLNILQRLREAQTVLIRYHATIDIQSRGSGVPNHITKEPSLKALEGIEVSYSRDIQDQKVVVDKPEKTNQALKAEKSQRGESQHQLPQFLTNNSRVIHQTKSNQRVNDRYVKVGDRKNRILEKLAYLREQVRRQEKEAEFKRLSLHIRHHSQPTQEVFPRNTSLMGSVGRHTPILSQKRSEPTSLNKCRVTQKHQRIRFLKQVYRDKAQQDLENQLKVIRNKGRWLQVVQKRRKPKRKKSLTQQQCQLRCNNLYRLSNNRIQSLTSNSQPSRYKES